MLWNIFYIPIFQFKLVTEVYSIGFSDDLELVDTATQKQNTILTVNKAFNIIKIWLEVNSQGLAFVKTEYAIFSRRKERKNIEFVIQTDIKIKPKPAVKYLIVIIDSNEHVSSEQYRKQRRRWQYSQESYPTSKDQTQVKGYY